MNETIRTLLAVQNAQDAVDALFPGREDKIEIFLGVVAAALQGMVLSGAVNGRTFGDLLERISEHPMRRLVGDIADRMKEEVGA